MFTYIEDSRSLVLAGLAATMVAGCGGGQTGSPSANATLHTSQSGEAVITYYGQPKPQLTSSAGGVTVVGQAGATYSTITLEPPPKLDSTYLVIGYLSNEDYGALYRVPYPSGIPQLLFEDGMPLLDPAVSSYGTTAFFDGSVDDLRSIRADGTGLTSITFNQTDLDAQPHYSTDGTNRLAFVSGTSLYVGPGSGGQPTKIQLNDIGSGEAWNPAGTQIIYSAFVGGAGNSDLFMTPATGGTPKDVTPIGMQNTGTFTQPAWSPDGVSIAAQYQESGVNFSTVVRFNINNTTNVWTNTPSGDSEGEPQFSPDGTKVAVYRMTTNGQTSGIYVEDSAGQNEALLSADPAGLINTSLGGLSWSPFLPKETVVAASGSTFYHQAASGYLVSESGDQFGSFVAFTAATPGDAAIQSPSEVSASAPLAFTLTADSITSIGYINNYFGLGTTITLTSTPSAIVTIDSATGQVDLIAPAATPKASPTKNPDGTLTYKATFKAVFDGKGRNLAPNGTASLTVDPKTGRLVRVG